MDGFRSMRSALSCACFRRCRLHVQMLSTTKAATVASPWQNSYLSSSPVGLLTHHDSSIATHEDQATDEPDMRWEDEASFA